MAAHAAGNTLVALLTPEVVLALAAAQWAYAREVAAALEDAAQHGSANWSTTHAFFVMMGGFHAFEGDSPHHVLSLPEVMELVRDGTLVAPLDDDIWALSKAGIFSKTCALFQTLWFVVQCLARALQHLPLAQLEVATLAYTTMTVSMYLFWWNKPLRIDRPFRVQWHDKALVPSLQNGLALQDSGPADQTGLSPRSPALISLHSLHSAQSSASSSRASLHTALLDASPRTPGAAESDIPAHQRRASSLLVGSVDYEAPADQSSRPSESPAPVSLHSRQSSRSSASSRGHTALLGGSASPSPAESDAYIAMPSHERLASFSMQAVSSANDEADPDQSRRSPGSPAPISLHSRRSSQDSVASTALPRERLVSFLPMLGVGSVDYDVIPARAELSYCLSLAIEAVFGSIHLLSLEGTFPSPRARLVWRLSAFAITVVPLLLLAPGLLLGLAFALSYVLPRRLTTAVFREKAWAAWLALAAAALEPASVRAGWAATWATRLFMVGYGLFMFVAQWSYMIARFAILVTCFTTLRDLPDGAYRTVAWTAFFPHV
ncbi:hypothetical protein HWV62_22604 [Athelia sp. TMB]|nr:hypothetical protein HWV62_22604 [Athelia sp. TMB]